MRQELNLIKTVLILEDLILGEFIKSLEKNLMKMAMMKMELIGKLNTVNVYYA